MIRAIFLRIREGREVGEHGRTELSLGGVALFSLLRLREALAMVGMKEGPLEGERP